MENLIKPENGKTLLWVIDGSLKDKMHKNARIKPALELVKAGWKVVIVTSGAPENNREFPIQFVEISWPNIYLIGSIIYYLKSVKMILFGKINVNILFFQMDSFALIFLLVFLWQKITKNKKCKIVVDFRSLPMDTKSTKGKFRSIVFYLGVFFCRQLNLKITGITIQLLEYLNFRKNQILGLWPSGADIDDFEGCYKKRFWPGENDPIRIVYIGALTTERNLISAIRGAQIAKNRGVNLTFNIVGDGNQKKDLIELSEKEGYEFVTVDGPFPYQMIPDLLSKNDVGILPFKNVKKMKVSSAIKMFEYMAAGLPILATKIQAHKNVLSSKEFVFWTNENEASFARAIEEINNKKEQLPKLGLKAKIFSLNWSWEKSGEKLSNALTRALK